MLVVNVKDGRYRLLMVRVRLFVVIISSKGHSSVMMVILLIMMDAHLCASGSSR